MSIRKIRTDTYPFQAEFMDQEGDVMKIEYLGDDAVNIHTPKDTYVQLSIDDLYDLIELIEDWDIISTGNPKGKINSMIKNIDHTTPIELPKEPYLPPSTE